MTRASTVAVIDRRRLLLVSCMSLLGVAFNYGSTVTSVFDAVAFATVFVVGGYLLFTLWGLLADRYWWE